MKTPIRSDKCDVRMFLSDLQTALSVPCFDVNRDFILIRSRKAESRERYSTPYTLLDLEYDAEDVVSRLKELRLEEYSETLWDKDDDHPPLLWVFGKKIEGKLVYIKIKIRKNKKAKVLCVSFHYAEHEMLFPYA